MEKSESREIQQEAVVSIKIEYKNAEIKNERRTSGGNEKLENEVRTMFQTLECQSSTTASKCRIYRVPYHLRKVNEEAYTPQVISIGPIHHNEPRFQTMEKHKVRYLKSFIERGGIETKLEKLVETIKEMEDRIRHCYVVTILLESDDFVKMIMLDASFILEFFLNSGKKDAMFVEEWLPRVVWQDLLLLENQLPFFVLEKLYDLAFAHHDSKYVPLIDLAFNFFRVLNIHEVPSVNVKIEHFTDLLSLFCLPANNRGEDDTFLEVPCVNVKIEHYTDLLRRFRLCGKLPANNRGEDDTFLRYSATQLHEAGVEFRKRDSSKCSLNLNFKKGVLEIPPLEFEDNTEAFVRNIMALEQCHAGRFASVTGFYLILDDLINTTKDVDLLIDKGIIKNRLGDSNAVTSMINNLNKGIFRIGDISSDYTALCNDLNTFYEKPWHKWKATLRHQYFSTPWRTASTIAAIILLVLTSVQTVYSIIK